MSFPFEGLDGVRRKFPAGHALLHEGVPPERVLILVEGRVKIVSSGVEGRETVLAFRSPGEVLGELSAVDGGAASATVIAVDEVECLAVPIEDFRAYLARTPEAAFYLLERMVARLREADKRRAEFTTSDTLGRVAARLLELAERYGSDAEAGTHIDLPITQEELAAWVGSSREGVNKALQSLRSLRWIEVERRSITVLDPDALRRRAQA